MNEEFGDEAVETLVDHWGDNMAKQHVDVPAIPSEWDMLKQLLYRSELEIYKTSWAEINERFRVKVPNILDLMDLVLSLPASSAECERGFSQMKIIKTEYRNRMTSSTLTQVLRIKLNSASISDFDPTPAIHTWNTGKRRPTPHCTSRLQALNQAGSSQPAKQESEQETEAGLETADHMAIDAVESESDYEFGQSSEEDPDLFGFVD
jgi:hypothetical protein